MKIRFEDLLEDDGWSKLSDGSWITPWAQYSDEAKAQATAYAWDQWIIACCVETTGEHAWWLDWDEEDGLELHCQHCPAGVNELYPDGQDLIDGEIPLPDGSKLVIGSGGVFGDPPVTEWHGPVRATTWTRVYRSWEYPDEYDCGIIVEAL